MARARTVLGLVGGGMLILSSAAHSFLGWKELGGKLQAAGVPAELVAGLRVGWHFGGVAMLAFGVILVALFVQRLRGQPVSGLPAYVTGAAYLLFALGAILDGGFDPFYVVFILPGALLLVAAPQARGSIGSPA